MQELCAALAPVEVDRALLRGYARSLTEQNTAGNPLFVTEVLRQWADPTTSSAAGSLPDGIPPNLQEVISRRVAALGAKAARILALASVIGVEFDLETLASVADIERDDLLDIAEHAMRSALVRSGAGNEMRFAHAVVQ